MSISLSKVPKVGFTKSKCFQISLSHLQLDRSKGSWQFLMSFD